MHRPNDSSGSRIISRDKTALGCACTAALQNEYTSYYQILDRILGYFAIQSIRPVWVGVPPTSPKSQVDCF